jgi:hypothetical protein
MQSYLDFFSFYFEIVSFIVFYVSAQKDLNITNLNIASIQIALITVT